MALKGVYVMREWCTLGNPCFCWYDFVKKFDGFLCVWPMVHTLVISLTTVYQLHRQKFHGKQLFDAYHQQLLSEHPFIRLSWSYVRKWSLVDIQNKISWNVMICYCRWYWSLKSKNLSSQRNWAEGSFQ